MPLYEYQCDACGARFELIRKFSDPPLTTCPTCGKDQVRKLISSPAFQFKGSGWYVTDYARKSEGGGESKASASKDSAETKPAPAEGSKSSDKAAEKRAAQPAPASDTKDKSA